MFEDGKMFDGSSIAGWKGINESRTGDRILQALIFFPCRFSATCLSLACNLIIEHKKRVHHAAYGHRPNNGIGCTRSRFRRSFIKRSGSNRAVIDWRGVFKQFMDSVRQCQAGSNPLQHGSSHGLRINLKSVFYRHSRVLVLYRKIRRLKQLRNAFLCVHFRKPAFC